MSERNEIKRDGAMAQKNSGRGLAKGDARWHSFLVDYKEARKTFSLTRTVWAKLCSDTFAVDRQRFPVLKIILGEGNQKTRLAIIEWELLEQLVTAYEKNNETGPS